MAFPWIFEENFELGTKGDWSSTSDTGTLIDYPHYSTLVNSTVNFGAPYRGAYVMRINLSGGDTNDHTVTSTAIVCADAATVYTRFYMWVSRDFTASADDLFQLFEFQQAGGTVEGSLGMRITAATNLLEIGIGDGTAPSNYVTYHYRGKWVCVEQVYKVSTGGSGTYTLYLDGASVIALTSLTNAAAVGKGVLGTQDTLSTTTGWLLFDQFICDDARIYPISIRYPEQVLLTKSGHVFVGAGVIDNASLLSGGGTDNVLSLYDTDNAGVNDAFNVKLELKNVATGDIVDPAGVPAAFQRGCFVQLSGTNPRAMINIHHAQGYWSEGRIKQHGKKRIPAPGGF